MCKKGEQRYFVLDFFLINSETVIGKQGQKLPTKKEKNGG
jgi:hypothetical protein